MPYTFNGIGTKYYGKRDKEQDGSYITTLFIVFIYFPIIPLGSYRVLPKGTESLTGNLAYTSSSMDFLVKKVPLNIIQLLLVYLTAFTILFGIPYIVIEVL